MILLERTIDVTKVNTLNTFANSREVFASGNYSTVNQIINKHSIIKTGH